MLKRTANMSKWSGYRKSLIFGCAAGILYLLILLILAWMGETHQKLLAWKNTSKFIFAATAMLCGILTGRIARENKLLHSLTGEWMFFILLIVSAARNINDLNMISLGIILFLMLFGAFAGAVLQRDRHHKQKGKR